MLLAIIRYLHSWKRYGSAVQELSQLNDRELADIGINRGDIPRIAWEHAGQSARMAQLAVGPQPGAVFSTDR